MEEEEQQVSRLSPKGSALEHHTRQGTISGSISTRHCDEEGRSIREDHGVLVSIVAAEDEPPFVRELAKVPGVSFDTVHSRKNEVAELVASLWLDGVRTRSNVKKDRFTR